MRLKNEVAQFILDIEEKNFEEADEEIDPAELLDHVKRMQLELSNVDLQKVQLGDKSTLFKSQGLDTQNLLNILSSKGDMEDKKLHYELFYSNELSSNKNISQLADIDRRISKLESSIGEDTEFTKQQGLVQTVSQLKGEISKINEESVIALTHQLNSALSQEGQESDQLEVSEDVNAKIDTLFEATEKLAPLSSELSQIVNRLIQLKTVHQRAAEFTSQLQILSSEQSTTKNMVEKNIEYLRKMEQSLFENINIIQSNMKKIEERISK